MKAVVYTRYGPPDVLRLAEVARPVPKSNELLVRVHATTVNRSDCGYRPPDPFFVRIFSGLRRPKRPILGTEFAGVVAAVGDNVNRFSEGDRVFGLTGDNFGAQAEFVCVPEDGSVATLPATMTDAEAAAVCDGAMLALSCLRKVRIRSGQRVLIYGASGSIGTAAVQLAKHFGAYVTAVCDTKHLELAKSLGADAVIDYTREDFTKHGQVYDIVFDAVGKSSFGRCRRLLKPGGIYIATDLGFLWQNPFLALATAVAGTKRVVFPIPKHGTREIAFFKKLVEAGRLRPVIDRQYPLEQIVEAYRYVETGQKIGNVVITVAQPETA